MYKDLLLKSIIKEMKIVRRLATKIPADQHDFRKKEGMRSTLELCQYLSGCGTGMIRYWYRTDGSDFRTFISSINAPAKELTIQDFPKAMDAQIELVTKLFENITDHDLLNKEVDLPWGEKVMLAEGIMETSIKWLTGYKMQLFLALKLSSGETLATPDLWRKTELETA
jgi:hypothetical protein